MSITVLKDKLSQHSRPTRQRRGLSRAIASVPTHASPQGLLGLVAYNNS